MTAALRFDDVSIDYGQGATARPVLRNVSFTIGAGEAYGLVGESGCGKSTAAFATMRALPPSGILRAGRILVAGTDIAALQPAALRRLRAERVSMVYQDPGRALNPSLTIGRQLGEAYELLGSARAEAADQALRMLGRMQIAGPARVMRAYPHELSGGMQQRVVIAMALAKNPALLVLDEPTTGLDATVEAAVLDLIAGLRREFDTALLFISHNLKVVARICDRVGVLYAGALVEEGPAHAVLRHPRHPYTAALLQCQPAGQAAHGTRLRTIDGSLPDPANWPSGCVFAPRCNRVTNVCAVAPPLTDNNGHGVRCYHPDGATPAPAASQTEAALTDGPALLELVAVSRHFGTATHRIQALHDVSLTIHAGETLGLVGESGSGKTTLARIMLGMDAPDAGGRVTLSGETLAPAATRRSLAQRKALQMVFQNPDSALNRAHRVRHILARPLARLAGLRGAALRDRLRSLAASVRLTRQHLPQRPRALSGGLKQRVAIARAFAGGPRLVVCDEPTSALDVSVQAAVLNLLADLQARDRVSYVLISHDLAVVRYLAHRIAVLYRGRIVQLGTTAAVLNGPHHPYTETLLAAAGIGDAVALSTSQETPASGCRFAPRCHRKIGKICETDEPKLLGDAINATRCHLGMT